MAVSGFNIGKEASVELVHPTLGIIPLGLVTSFQSKPTTGLQKSVPITNGGKPIHRVTYSGWEGTFVADRASGILDTLFQYLEETYYAGGGETYFLIHESIRNPDGTIDSFRYVNTVIQPTDHGDWKAEEKVTQQFTFAASNREKV